MEATQTARWRSPDQNEPSDRASSDLLNGFQSPPQSETVHGKISFI